MQIDRFPYFLNFSEEQTRMFQEEIRKVKEILTEASLNTLKVFPSQKDLSWYAEETRSLQPTNPNFNKESWRKRR